MSSILMVHHSKFPTEDHSRPDREEVGLAGLAATAEAEALVDAANEEGEVAVVGTEMVEAMVAMVLEATMLQPMSPLSITEQVLPMLLVLHQTLR